MITPRFIQQVCGIKWSNTFNCFMYLSPFQTYFKIWMEGQLIVHEQYFVEFASVIYPNSYDSFLHNLYEER